MILLKGFFNYKSTKIYLVILTVMLLTISILFSFSQYYSTIINSTYQKNSYFLVISEDDVGDIIKENKLAVNIENVALLEPEGINYFESQDINNSFLLDQDNDYIIAISNKKYEIELKDNQVAIKLSEFMLDNVTGLSNLMGKVIFLSIENSEKHFDIVKIYESNFARVIVSDNVFEKLMLKNKLHAYTFLLSDYNQKQEIFNYFEAKDNIQIKFLQYYDSESQLNTVQTLENIFNVVSKGCAIAIMFFLVLFLIITYNIVSDELDRMHIERLLGYNKLQVKVILILKIITLDSIAILFYFTSHIIVNILLINFFEIDVELFNFKIIYLIIFIILVSIFLCSFARIKHKD